VRITDTSDLWWKSAVVYCLDVETFLDWDDDGTGDLIGLSHRLDYLESLGVTCLWLMPFYPSPDRDDGYDISDFYGVDPRLGHLGDLVELIRTARDRGMRVIADLVVNHTSDQHPWFQAARSDRDSPYRDFYVWSDEVPADSPEPTFPDQETSVWTFDERAGQYYLHRFYRHQPDLNVTNPKVRDEIVKMMGYWLQLGMSGFRVDAVPFLLETLGVDDAEADSLPDPHTYLRQLRAFVGRRTGDGILLGEVNLPYEQQTAFFGSDRGDELTMQFDFVGMQQLYLALARRDARPLAAALAARPTPPEGCQWASFVRNHDELTLDKLTDQERNEVFDAFGPDPSMQVFGRGLARRLPPMMGGDQRRIRMIYSLLFALPGTPVLFYGEEIGMGEHPEVSGRQAVRTPMQWTPDETGGFSSAPAEQFPSPVVTGTFGPDNINVADQLNDDDSLLSFTQQLTRRYRSCPELGWGSCEVLSQPSPAVLALQTSWDDASVITLHNFADVAADVRCRPTLPAGDVILTELADGSTIRPDRDGWVQLRLEPYGHSWLRVTDTSSREIT
jgi:trehalose synthase